MKHFLQICLVLMCWLVTNLVQAGSLERLFAPKAELWEFWASHNTAATHNINHQVWSEFLHNNVVESQDGINRIHYAAVSEEDKVQLQHYINTLSQLSITDYSRSQQLPYWINLYNALTIDMVLQYYPVAGIRDIDISPGFFSDGPWDKKLVSIQDKMVSLNDIEHRILRPIWKDARIHYALNCASLGCPNLQATAFTSDNIDKLLHQAMVEYINHPRGVTIKDGKLIISSIYNWFQDDFGKNETEVVMHIRQYASPGLRKQLSTINFISDYDYDWSLNDAQPIKTPPDTTDESDSFD